MAKYFEIQCYLEFIISLVHPPLAMYMKKNVRQKKSFWTWKLWQQYFFSYFHLFMKVISVVSSEIQLLFISEKHANTSLPLSSINELKVIWKSRELIFVTIVLILD